MSTNGAIVPLFFHGCFVFVVATVSVPVYRYSIELRSKFWYQDIITFEVVAQWKITQSISVSCILDAFSTIAIIFRFLLNIPH